MWLVFAVRRPCMQARKRSHGFVRCVLGYLTMLAAPYALRGARLLWSSEKVRFDADSLRSSPINRRMRLLCLRVRSELVSFSLLHFEPVPVYDLRDYSKKKYTKENQTVSKSEWWMPSHFQLCTHCVSTFYYSCRCGADCSTEKIDCKTIWWNGTMHIAH